MTAFHPIPDIKLISRFKSANDPKRSSGGIQYLVAGESQRIKQYIRV